ncbi:uncharacterized protein E0L32_010167 [Thyridium curvatum]|uniref:Uncharacterized protein n=1 Tax=Thyridium curvatum TaxID=1093900 RepID=A0A507AV43_9PEZI|nr:uncharacterized protein E0L32_010167 [Thyridium curvatum]TPX08100.1 hypothetical protein E0L32_010167 [Thyridium curvatum]
MKTFFIATVLPAFVLGLGLREVDAVNPDCTTTVTFPPLVISTPPSGPPVRTYTITWSEPPQACVVIEACPDPHAQTKPATGLPTDLATATVVCQGPAGTSTLSKPITIPTGAPGGSGGPSPGGNPANPQSPANPGAPGAPAAPGPKPTQNSAAPNGGDSTSPAVVPGSSTTPATVVTAGTSPLRATYLGSSIAVVLVLGNFFL